MGSSNDDLKVKLINKFTGDFRFLSTFYPCTVVFDHAFYKTVENAYRAAMTLDLSRRKFIASLSPGKARKFAEAFVPRDDWSKIETQVMFDLQLQKFENPFIRPLLIETGNAEIVQGNTWHDNFWGVCSCTECKKLPAQNQLGKMLMNIRSTLK